VGGKQLSLDNWTEPDATSAQFGQLSPLIGPRPMDGQDWARAFLAVELKPHVPESVRELFAVARGVLLYGWFFYPLFHLGEEQLYRVVEAAATACYETLGGPRSRPSFAEAVDWLTKRGVIPGDDRERWIAIRRLRNAASHPDQQSVMVPGQALGTLKATAHDINRLFARSAGIAADRT
jgi:hypothetical protein